MQGDPAPVRFSDLEFEVEGIKFMWSGECCVDQDGLVETIYVEWLGQGPGDIHYDVPSRRATLDSFKSKVIRTCADTLETRYVHEIKESVDEWHVSRAEQQWEAAE